MDYRGLILPRCALIEPSKAINLHSTRSATERRGGADLIGGVAGQGYIEIHIRIGDEASESSAAFQVEFWEHGDTFDEFGEPPGPPPAPAVNEDSQVKAYKVGGALAFTCTEYLNQTDSSAANEYNGGRGLATQIPTPSGYTRHIWGQAAGDAFGVAHEQIEKIEVIDVASGAIVRSFSGFQPHQLESAGAAEDTADRYIEPFCFAGPFEDGFSCGATSSGREIVVRWRQHDAGGGLWNFVPTVGTARVFSSGSCALSPLSGFTYFVKDTEGNDKEIGVNHTWTAADPDYPDHPICAGGAWPDTSGTEWDPSWTSTTQSGGVGAFKTATLSRIDWGAGPDWEFSPLGEYFLNNGPGL